MNIEFVKQEPTSIFDQKVELEKAIERSLYRKRIIVIAGPTACGKSSLGIEIAKMVSGEIISADSMQVYKGMDIGTAKVTKEERDEVPHHLIDICEVHEHFNVVNFYHAATQVCREILSRKKVPIIVGGTGFYLHSLIYGPPQGPPSSPELRQRLEQEMEEKGVDHMYRKLEELDAHYAKTISNRDKHKIIRALEIIILTEKDLKHFARLQSDFRPREFDFRCWFVFYEKEQLYPRIEVRCDEMIANGFAQEVECLVEKGLRENLTASQAIGYRQYLDYLESKKTDQDWDQFVWDFKKATRRYAKRQFTWFRKEPLFIWLDQGRLSRKEILETILEDYTHPGCG